MPVKIANNATGRLATNITASDTSITLQAGNGSAFPALAAGDWFPATIYRADGALEIVKVTARASDVFTITRGQEGTAPKSFSLGDRIELRLTAGTLTAMLTAAGILFTPTGGMVATDVQAALTELNTNKQVAGSYAPAVHTHTWAQITGTPATFPPTIGTTSTTAKAGNYVPAWSEITGKPATFAPTIGTTSTTAKAGDYAPAWTDVTSKPTTFTPAAHTQAWSTITSPPVYTTRWPAWTEVTSKPATFPVAAADVGTANAALGFRAVGTYTVGTSSSARSLGAVYSASSVGLGSTGTYRIMGLVASASGTGGGEGGTGGTSSYSYLCLRVT